jgi:acetoin utilization deacetylase AcuC-like enzyme
MTTQQHAAPNAAPAPFRIPVFYTPEMVADAASFSRSAAKPQWVVEAWRRDDAPLEVLAPQPLTVDELSTAHDRTHVEEILDCRRPNGFGNRLPAVARALPFTSGAMYAAAKAALENGRVAVAPVSGFHHAAWDHNHGFCTFNGLAIAARLLRRRHLAQRVGILDCDEHEGDGTDEIIERLGIDWIHHHTVGAEHYSAKDARRFLDGLPAVLEEMKRFGCEVVLYQAGADPHVDDPFGGFLTDAQLQERDEIVFDTCRRLALPVAWNLAGGYRLDADDKPTPVVEVHRRTMQACVRTYATRSA